jgi:hypothetical protein
VVVLAPGPAGAYFTGKLSVKVNPVKITVVLTEGDHTEVVLCNYRPGRVIVVGASAPEIVLLVATSWAVVVRPTVVIDAPVVIHRKGKGKHKHHFKRGGGVHISF